jgi:hypothetical protein
MDILTPFLSKGNKQASQNDIEVQERISRIEALISQQNFLLQQRNSASSNSQNLETEGQECQLTKPTDRFGKMHKKIALVSLMAGNYYNCILQNNLEFVSNQDQFNRRVVPTMVDPRRKLVIPPQHQYLINQKNPKMV